jgi:hypothetical protein
MFWVRKDAQFGCSRDAGFAGAAARKRCGVDLTARQTIGSRSVRAARLASRAESAIQTHGQAIRSTRRATLRPKKERSLYKRLPDNLP